MLNGKIEFKGYLEKHLGSTTFKSGNGSKEILLIRCPGYRDEFRGINNPDDCLKVAYFLNDGKASGNIDLQIIKSILSKKDVSDRKVQGVAYLETFEFDAQSGGKDYGLSLRLYELKPFESHA